MTVLRVAEAVQRTDTGLQRRGNEDSSYARAPVFVVADGMGGAQAGEVASRIVTQTFEQGIPDAGSGEERLTTVVKAANAQIHERSRTEQENAGMGTTVTAVMLEEERIVIAHVGDSRAYLFRDGELRRLTQDHSLVDELVRQGKLTEEQAAEHPQRSIITRALGPEPDVEVDTWSYPSRAGDVILLCSDGLTSMISEPQISSDLQANPGLSQAADQLIRDANAAGGRDNITVVLFRVEEISQAAPTGDETMIAPQADPAVDPPTREAAAARLPVAPPPELPPDATSVGRVAVAERPGPRLARTQGAAQPAPPKRSRLRSEKLIKPVSALLAFVIVVFLIGGAGYIATRQLYFVGTNSQGIVTVYRGLPYEFVGVRLYESFYTSGVPGVLVPQDRRSSVFNHHLTSQSDASKLAMNIELGRVEK